MSLYARRPAIDLLVPALALGATRLGLLVLFLILGSLLANGLPALSLSTFVQATPAPGNQGGLSNAIYGSVVMTAVATIVGTPIGVLTGTYLAEYGRGTVLAPIVRFVND